MSDVTTEVAKYIADKRLSLEEMERELHIPKGKFMTGSKERLTAEEFLRLCVYLGIRPESFLSCVEGIGGKGAEQVIRTKKQKEEKIRKIEK